MSLGFIAVNALICAVFIQSSDVPDKYVPPHLREAADSKRKAELERLKRSLKGLINRYMWIPGELLCINYHHLCLGSDWSVS